MIQDQTNIPVPPGVTPTDCWSSARPAQPHDERAQPGDQPGHRVARPPHRRACQARLRARRDVRPDRRAPGGLRQLLRRRLSDVATRRTSARRRTRSSATCRGRSCAAPPTRSRTRFNQIHQEQETGADNSIMTTTPSVADVLGGPGNRCAGRVPGPDQAGHQHDRAPPPQPHARPGDPARRLAVRAAGSRPVPAGRRPLRLRSVRARPRRDCTSERACWAQPVELTWTLTNRSGWPLRGAQRREPRSAVRRRSRSPTAEGRERAVRPFVIACEHGQVGRARAGRQRVGDDRVFWSTSGFAFDRPGALPRQRRGHLVRARRPGATSKVRVEVFVDYPTSEADNDAAGLVMHAEVGKWVALGGEAYHLAEAGRRLMALSRGGHPAGRSRRRAKGGASRVLDGLADLLPEPQQAGAAQPDGRRRGAATARGRTTAAPARAKRAAKARRRTDAGGSHGDELRPRAATGDASMGRRPFRSTSRRSSATDVRRRDQHRER